MQAIAERGDPDFTLPWPSGQAMGTRPSREKQLAAIELARAVVTARMHGVTRGANPALVETHSRLVRLAAQAPTSNFDAGLLVMEIGTLLSSVAASKGAH